MKVEINGLWHDKDGLWNDEEVTKDSVTLEINDSRETLSICLITGKGSLFFNLKKFKNAVNFLSADWDDKWENYQP